MSNEFDHILHEKVELPTSPLNHRYDRKIILLPDSSSAATLTSSVSFEEMTDSAVAGGVDMYGDAIEGSLEEGVGMKTSDPRVSEIIRKEKKKIAMKSQPISKPPLSVRTLNYLKGKDFSEIFFTVLVPIIGGYYLLNKAMGEAAIRVKGKADKILDDYSNEMIYHDGDFVEMKLAHDDYNKRLMFMGPKKGSAMIKRYLEFYARKKTVSPQSISSLSYAFSIFKLTEEKAAEILSEICTAMPEKIASAGKLYFFGNRILRSPEAKVKLQPIFKLLASQYMDDGVISGEEIVNKSQIAMGEAAYRAAVASAGKNQTELTIGWDILGLDKEIAMKIFEEVAGEGFLTQREAKYGAKQQKFDDKGRKVEDDGTLENTEEAGDDDDEGNDVIKSPSGNVQECTNCGFTLFVAEGRDFKFFNSDFKCPECGAPKDSFKAVDFDG